MALGTVMTIPIQVSQCHIVLEAGKLAEVETREVHWTSKVAVITNVHSQQQRNDGVRVVCSLHWGLLATCSKMTV